MGFNDYLQKINESNQLSILSDKSGFSAYVKKINEEKLEEGKLADVFKYLKVKKLVKKIKKLVMSKADLEIEEIVYTHSPKWNEKANKKEWKDAQAKKIKTADDQVTAYMAKIKEIATTTATKNLASLAKINAEIGANKKIMKAMKKYMKDTVKADKKFELIRKQEDDVKKLDAAVKKEEDAKKEEIKKAEEANKKYVSATKGKKQGSDGDDGAVKVHNPLTNKDEYWVSAGEETNPNAEQGSGEETKPKEEGSGEEEKKKDEE